MKLAYVTPRYGAEVIGGAELGARLLAEHVVSQLGWDVEALTTCARDAITWADEYPEGVTIEGGVRVRRMRSVSGRSPDFEPLSQRVLADPGAASMADQRLWIERQGPFSPALIQAVEGSDADVVIFYPYLYHPTVEGIMRIGSRRSLMHPATHDERPIHLPIFRKVFAAAGGFSFQTLAERRTTERLFSLGTRPQGMVGLGVAAEAGDPEAARTALGLGDRPYLLAVGRVDDGKGTSLLARAFAAYKQRRPGSLCLVYAGPVIDAPPEHPDLIVAGRVDEATKWGLLRGATVYVSPSFYESFSLALLEGWLGGAPALVWAGCDALTEHCRRSGGGLWYDDYPGFEAALDRLMSDPDLRGTMAERGRSYVSAHYTWPAVIHRYRALLERVAGARALEGA